MTRTRILSVALTCAISLSVLSTGSTPSTHSSASAQQQYSTDCIGFQPDKGKVKDTFVFSKDPTAKSGKLNKFYVGFDRTYDFRIERSFMHFDLSSFRDMVIENAELKLTLGQSQGNSNLSIEAFEAIGRWEEDTLDFNTASGLMGSSVIGRSQSIPTGPPNLQVVIPLDKSIVQRWIDTSYEGLVLKSTDESPGKGDRSFWSKDCTPSLCGGDSAWPKLCLTHRKRIKALELNFTQTTNRPNGGDGTRALRSGDVATYIVKYKNAGDITFNNLMIDGSIPDFTEFDANRSLKVRYIRDMKRVESEVETLSTGHEREIQYAVKVDIPQTPTPTSLPMPTSTPSVTPRPSATLTPSGTNTPTPTPSQWVTEQATTQVPTPATEVPPTTSPTPTMTPIPTKEVDAIARLVRLIPNADLMIGKRDLQNFAAGAIHFPNATNGQVHTSGVHAQLVYRKRVNRPSDQPPSEWTAIDAAYCDQSCRMSNKLVNSIENRIVDVYLARIVPFSDGEYEYLFRFSHSGGPWVYGGRNGQGAEGVLDPTGNEFGVFNVPKESLGIATNSIKEAQIVRATSTPQARIGYEARESVRARIEIKGVTSKPGRGEGVRAQLLYGLKPTNPISSVLEWRFVEAHFFVDDRDADVYEAYVVPFVPAGEYSYAFRFKYWMGIDWSEWIYAFTIGKGVTETEVKTEQSWAKKYWENATGKLIIEETPRTLRQPVQALKSVRSIQQHDPVPPRYLVINSCINVSENGVLLKPGLLRVTGQGYLYVDKNGAARICIGNPTDISFAIQLPFVRSP